MSLIQFYNPKGGIKLRPSLLGRLGTSAKPKFEYFVRAHTAGGYVKQGNFASDVELSDKQAITKAKIIMGDCYGSHKWEVERL